MTAVRRVRGLLDGLTVLVVDDEEDARELLAALLEISGAVVQMAHSVADARALLVTSSFDVIVSDIGMPGEDGYSFLKTLREDERLRGQPHVPAVALTAYSQKADRDRAVASGFDVHMAKPVDRSRLLETLQRLTGRGSVESG